MHKPELRQSLLAERAALAANDTHTKRLMDDRIGARLLQWLQAEKTTSAGVYWPMRGEPDLHATFEALHNNGIQLSLPVVVSKNAPLKFVAWTPGEAMQDDRYGTMTPAAPHQETFPQTLVIPCVGFNQHRFRLGYGGGFYDRTVALIPRPRTVGVAYSFSAVSFMPDTYDIALDALLTDTGCLTG